MNRRRTPRTLRAEEHALWAEIARSANPLSVPGRPPGLPRPPAATPVARQSPPAAQAAPGRVPSFRIGERAESGPGEHFGPMPGPPTQRPLAPRMDARSLSRMMRGKLAPEGRIDLHGLTLSQAQPALSRFVQGSHAAGLRLVLVITGKGRTEPDAHPADRRSGALRREVPLWLSRPPLVAMVLQVVPAHLRHGGSGAYYVYLARRRS